MVFDCFVFLNEFDALQIRLEELADVVDFHVLVESTLTFSGKPKSLRFLQQRERFAEFAPKIIHYVIPPEVLGVLPGSWEREARSRLAMTEAVHNLASAGDTVMFSDTDEIPSPECVRQAAAFRGVTRFVMTYNYYLLDLRSNLEAPATVALPWGMMQGAGLSPQQLREGRYGGLPAKEIAGGWHYSFLSRDPTADVREKLESYSHAEFSGDRWWNQEHVLDCIREGRDLLERKHMTFRRVPLDETFPLCVQRDPARFAELLSPTNRA